MKYHYLKHSNCGYKDHKTKLKQKRFTNTYNDEFLGDVSFD